MLYYFKIHLWVKLTLHCLHLHSPPNGDVSADICPHNHLGTFWEEMQLRIHPNDSEFSWARYLLQRLLMYSSAHLNGTIVALKSMLRPLDMGDVGIPLLPCPWCYWALWLHNKMLPVSALPLLQPMHLLHLQQFPPQLWDVFAGLNVFLPGMRKCW